MTALAAHAREAGFQQAALEVAGDDGVHHPAPATMLALEVVLTAAADALEVVGQQPEQR